MAIHYIDYLLTYLLTETPYMLDTTGVDVQLLNNVTSKA